MAWTTIVMDFQTMKMTALMEMETTATYDEATEEFIIDSPTTLSQKYWITNGAVHAHQWCRGFKQNRRSTDAAFMHARAELLPEGEGGELRRRLHFVLPRGNRYCAMTYYSSFKNHYRRMYTTPDYKEKLRCTPSDEPCWCPAA